MLAGGVGAGTNSQMVRSQSFSTLPQRRAVAESDTPGTGNLSVARKINVHQLIPLNLFHEIVADPVYARGDGDPGPIANYFPQLYHPETRIIWAHKALASITILAAKICSAYFQWRLRVVDCLRPIEAQQQMANYDYPAQLVSPPGTGGHPRGMAIDIIPEYHSPVGWTQVDMGVSFDHFCAAPHLALIDESENHGSRDHTRFDGPPKRSLDVYLNRSKLEFAMKRAASALDQSIWAYPEEWWDFRLHPRVFDSYIAVSEADLLPCQRVMKPDLEAAKAILDYRLPEVMEHEVDTVRRQVERVWKVSFKGSEQELFPLTL